LVCDVLTECKDSGNMVENSGRICNLLQVLIKCYSLDIDFEKFMDLEERIRYLKRANNESNTNREKNYGA